MKRILSGFFALFFTVCAYANIVKNGGFESLDRWGKALHNQNFAAVSQDKVDYIEGEKSLRMQINDSPRVYICVSQHLNLKASDRIAKGSFQYKAPNSSGMFLLNFYGKKGLKNLAINLPQTSEWKKIEFDHIFGEGAKSARIEIRLNKKGFMLVDDVKIETRGASAEQSKFDILFVNVGATFNTGKLSAVFEEGLKKHGFKNLQFCNWDDLTPDLLKRSRCVTIFPLQRLTFSKEDDARFNLIKEYVNQGGGLLITQIVGQMLADSLLSVKLGDMFGADIRYEKTIFNKEKIVKLGDQHGDAYYRCNDIAAPFNKGVKSMLFPAAEVGSIIGNVPFAGDKNWQVILKADEKTFSQVPRTFVLNVYQERVNGRTPFKSHVPMAGVRKYGKGHVAYIGAEPSCSFVMHDNQKQGRKIAEQLFAADGFMAFMNNLYDYLSVNSGQLANAKFTPIPEATEDIAAPKLYRGIIGARTVYSSGKSTVAQYVAAAKKAGLDYIIFLEEFDKLSYKNFEELRKECKKFSDKNFLAIPGFTYKNIDNNNQYVYGDYPLYPADILLDKNRRFKTTDEKLSFTSGLDLLYLYSQLSFQANSGWYNFSSNPYPAIDMRSVASMAVISQENGKTVDNAESDYANINRNVQYIWPLALTLMKSADEIKLVENGTYYHNQFFADSFTQFKKMLTTKAARSARNRYPGVPCYGKMFLTQGPVLTLDMPRGDMNPEGSLYASVLNVWPLKLHAESSDGIKTVEIYDGETLLKRFPLNGKKTFDYNTIFPNNRQRHIWGKLISMNGRTAITRSMSSDSWILRDLYCMDRNNPLFYSVQKRPDGKDFLMNYAADGVIPWKGPWSARIRAVGAFVSDPIYGKGKLRYDGSPEWHPQGSLRPAIYTNDKIAPNYGRHSWTGDFIHNVEGGVHNRPNVEVLSSNVLIATQKMDGVFPVGAFPLIHTHATLFPFKKSEYLETTARRTHYLVRVGGVAPWLYEQHFKVLKDYQVKGENKFFLSPGGISLRGSKLLRAWLNGQEVKSPKGIFKLKKGDFLTYEGSFYGTLAVYILSDGLTFDSRNHRFVYTAPEGVAKAGTEYDLKLLFCGINRLEKDPFAVALKYGRDFGLIEKGKTGYTVDIQQGKILNNEYTLDLDGAFKGTVKNLAACNGNLGVRLFNMNDNFGVMLSCDGRKRLLPVENGIAYAVLNEIENDKKIVIDNPFTASSKDIKISVSGDHSYSKWVAEIHNPTEKNVKTVIKPNPDLTGLHKSETITLAPGAVIIKEFK